MYSLHRLIGLRKIKTHLSEGRFGVIASERKAIGFIFISACILTLLSLTQLPKQYFLLLIIPVISSVLYVLPLSGNGTRVRDLPYIKIFLIAVIWSWVAVVIPLHQELGSNRFFILFVEKCFFIFAITIPFDIRDRNIDESTGLKTLITSFGMAWAKKWSIALILGAVICLLILYSIGDVKLSHVILIILSYLIAAKLILGANPDKSDLYYTGYLDGTILLRALAIILVSL